jgi:mRNA interferase MazF
MKEGSIVLASIPQSDGNIKTRPVIILRAMPPYRDWLVCGISTQLHQLVVGFDEIIDPEDLDFIASGLKSRSLIRLGFLSLLPRRMIIGSIGSISPDRHQRLLTKFSDYLLDSVKPIPE